MLKKATVPLTVSKLFRQQLFMARLRHCLRLPTINYWKLKFPLSAVFMVHCVDRTTRIELRAKMEK